MGPRWGCLSQDRPSRFVIAWEAAKSEEEAAPSVLQQTRQRTKGQVGSAFVSDGNAIYAQHIQKIYRDPVHTGKRGRPRLELRSDVALTQGVKQRVAGRVVGFVVRAVLGAASACAVCVHVERRERCLGRSSELFDAQAPCLLQE